MTTGTWDVANGVADWGYDEAASQGNSKWLYFYTVPKSGDDTQLVIRASDNDPNTGPTGYTNWKLVWSTYMESGATLRVVKQLGNKWHLAAYSLVEEVSNFAPDGSYQTKDLSNFVPATASVASIVALSSTGDGNNVNIRFSTDGGTTQHLYTVNDGITDTITTMLNLAFEFPFFSARNLYYRRERVSGSSNLAYWALKVTGWTDEWIDP